MALDGEGGLGGAPPAADGDDEFAPDEGAEHAGIDHEEGRAHGAREIHDAVEEILRGDEENGGDDEPGESDEDLHEQVFAGDAGEGVAEGGGEVRGGDGWANIASKLAPTFGKRSWRTRPTFFGGFHHFRRLRRRKSHSAQANRRMRARRTGE